MIVRTHVGNPPVLGGCSCFTRRIDDLAAGVATVIFSEHDHRS
jgi:hypothetical protein